jgi:hypothetical protein
MHVEDVAGANGLACIARHVTGCHLRQETRVYNVEVWLEDDVAGIICQAAPPPGPACTS